MSLESLVMHHQPPASGMSALADITQPGTAGAGGLFMLCNASRLGSSSGCYCLPMRRYTSVEDKMVVIRLPCTDRLVYRNPCD
jgi:hypothetical protein